MVDSLLESIGASREQYRRSAERSVLLDALDEALLAEAPQPAEADIQAFYDELYAEQKALFDEDENAFEAALLQDEIVVYRPVDLKLIQKASFMFDELAKSLIASASLTDAEEANAMMMDQYLRLADEVDPIYQALVAGEMTFAQVMEDLEPGSSEDVNYFHPSSTRFDEEYYQRANAFTTVGEVSTAYVIPYGYAILYYAGDWRPARRCRSRKCARRSPRSCRKKAAPNSSRNARRRCWPRPTCAMRRRANEPRRKQSARGVRADDLMPVAGHAAGLYVARPEPSLRHRRFFRRFAGKRRAQYAQSGTNEDLVYLLKTLSYRYVLQEEEALGRRYAPSGRTFRPRPRRTADLEALDDEEGTLLQVLSVVRQLGAK